MGRRTITTCDVCHKEEGERHVEGAYITRTADRFRQVALILRQAVVCSMPCAIVWLVTEWELVSRETNTSTTETVQKMCQCNVEGRHGHTASMCPRRAAFLDTKTNLAICVECEKLTTR